MLYSLDPFIAGYAGSDNLRTVNSAFPTPTALPTRSTTLISLTIFQGVHFSIACTHDLPQPLHTERTGTAHSHHGSSTVSILQTTKQPCSMSPLYRPKHEAQNPSPSKQEGHARSLPSRSTTAFSPSRPKTTSTTTSTTTKRQSKISHLPSSITKTRKEIDETQTRLDQAVAVLGRALESQNQTQTLSLSSSNPHPHPHSHPRSNGPPPLSHEDPDLKSSGESSRTQNQTATTTIAAAKKVVEAHIKLLTRYNATKDVAMGLLGMIAEGEGRVLGDVLRERGLALHDE